MEKGENTDFKVAKLEKPAKPQQTRRQRRQKRSQAFRTNTNAKVIDARNKTRNERLCQRSRLYPYPFLPGVVGFNSGAIRVYRKIRSVLEQQLKLFDECTLYRYTLCQLLYALSKPLPYLSNTLAPTLNISILCNLYMNERENFVSKRALSKKKSTYLSMLQYQIAVRPVTH
nr:unnamed protein product [Callosobruchus chinensis]